MSGCPCCHTCRTWRSGGAGAWRPRGRSAPARCWPSAWRSLAAPRAEAGCPLPSPSPQRPSSAAECCCCCPRCLESSPASYSSAKERERERERERTNGRKRCQQMKRGKQNERHGWNGRMGAGGKRGTSAAYAGAGGRGGEVRGGEWRRGRPGRAFPYCCVDERLKWARELTFARYGSPLDSLPPPCDGP